MEGLIEREDQHATQGARLSGLSLSINPSQVPLRGREHTGEAVSSLVQESR